MKRNKMIALSFLIAPCCATAVARADDAPETGFYVGANVGQTTVKASRKLLDQAGDVDTYHLDKQDTGSKAFVGYDFLPWLGIEGGFVDFGSPSHHVTAAPVGDVDGKVDAKGWEAFLIGTLPLGPVDLFAKVGGIESDIRFKVHEETFGINRSEDESNGMFAYGGGVSYNIGQFTLGAELDEYNVSKLDGLRLLSAGLTYHV